MKQIDQPAFDQLRLRDWRSHPQYRFVGKKYRPLRHGVDVAGEAEIFQITHKSRTKSAVARDPFKLLRRKLYRFEKRYRLFKSRCDEKIALWRQLADKELEDRRLLHALIEVALKHGELVEVGQQCAGL